MSRVLRNRHLAAMYEGTRSHCEFMFVAALTSVALYATGYPLWRVITVAVLPSGMALLESTMAKRTPPDEFDHVFKVISTVALVFLAVIVGVTGGLQGPLAPFLFFGAMFPNLVFGDGRFVTLQQTGLAAVIVLLAVLPESVLGPALPRDVHAYVTGGISVFALVILRKRASQFVRAARSSLDEVEKLRDERVFEASEQLKRLQQVSSRVAHELKNPLSAIKSLVQLTARSAEPKGQERLAVVQEEITRMEEILRDYQSFSRPLHDLRADRVDVGALVKDAAQVLSGRAEAGTVTLAVNAPSVVISADGRRLKEALINLIGNAIDASTPGGRVTVACSQAKGVETVVTIADNGRGMSAETLAQMGKAFFTTRPDGTGLGVILARGIVQQHGGTLEYESTFGAGTTATIRIPEALPPEDGLSACHRRMACTS